MTESRIKRRVTVKPLGRGSFRSESSVAVAFFALLAALPLVVSGYTIYILPQYLAYGLLAMSLGLLWGFVGILSFGQAAFFALGAYAMGLSETWGLGPDPAYVGLAASLVIGAALAAAIGYFLFSVDVRDVYFVLVTLALSIMVEQITVSQSEVTGGYNGMFVPRMSLGGTLTLSTDVAIYYFILPIVGIIYSLLRWLLAQPSGKILVGIRENEDRLISLGFRTPLYKTAAFAVSGAVACLAGALYGTDANFVSPSLGGVLFSTEVVVWVAIGGRESLLGALLGAVAVSALSTYLSAIIPNYWQLALGIVFIAVIIAFKGGVAGALKRVTEGHAGRKQHG
jgi:urea transport system permease protein